MQRYNKRRFVAYLISFLTKLPLKTVYLNGKSEGLPPFKLPGLPMEDPEEQIYFL